MHLIIDTSTEKGFAAIFNETKLLFSADIPYGLNNSKYLIPEIERGLNTLRLTSSDIKYVAVGIGPGSYTGIRVGVVVAKALSFALKIPLITFCSLESFLEKNDTAAIVDAKIGGFYIKKKFDSKPQIVELGRLLDVLKDVKVLVTPNASQLRIKIEKYYSDKWVILETGPHIDYINKYVLEKIKKADFSDINNVELLYLRKTQAEIERDKQSL